eukprot:GILI01005067.1.p1 GENE.GILI01005067.1~~GILI01005067.1.p1  ORF type:complete len:740 (-),score=243.70 GILI01005067.1:249-2468(-)
MSGQPSSLDKTKLALMGAAAVGTALLLPTVTANSLNAVDYALSVAQKCRKSKKNKKTVTGAHSVEVGPTMEGESRPRRYVGLESLSSEGCVLTPDGLLASSFQGVSTVWDLWRRDVSVYGPKKCMGHRPVKEVQVTKKVVDGRAIEWRTPVFNETVWLSFNEVDARIAEIAAGLKSLGVAKDSVVGLYEETRAEWMMTALACWSQAATIATVYANLGDEALVFALNQCSVPTIFTNGSLVPNLVAAKSHCPALTTVIYTDALPASVDVSKCGFRVVSFEEMIAHGKSVRADPVPPAADQLAVIMYTSGTSGPPKGVMITQGNIVASAAGITSCLPSIFGEGEESEGDMYCGFLPLAHVLELVAETAMLAHGRAIGYGTPRTLSSTAAKPHGDLLEFQPTLMCGVPRIWDSIKKEVSSKISRQNFLIRWLFNNAYKFKLGAMKSGRSTPLWDALVFNPVFKPIVGANLQGILSGGAPLSESTQEFLSVCLGVPVIQGYGLTETCAGGTIQPLELVTGVVGAPVACAEIKLKDCPEMNYTSKNAEPSGEVWIRGPCVSLGYYKDEQKTKEAFREGGWFATGDVGKWRSDGNLQIIDRVKNLFKLSFGEYVAPEKLESVYGASPFVSANGICVYGDSLADFLVALVIPHKQNLLQWAASQNLPHADNFNAVVRSPEARAAVLESLKGEAKKAKLKSFEVVKDLVLYADEWTPENGCLTAAMKLKRDVIKKRYESDIASMYDR